MNNRNAAQNTYTKKCQECKNNFESLRSDSKYCSNACRSRAHRRRRRNEQGRHQPGVYVPINRPIIRYFGGKWRIAPWIMQFFPRHTTYVEPFCGAANILFRKEPSMYEIINDLNADVVNFFDQLRLRPDDLIRAIKLTPFSRYEHRRAYEPVPDGDTLERARRFYIRSWQSYGAGEGKHNTGWRFQYRDRRGTSVVDEWSDVERLWQAVERLKTVQIESDDAFKVLNRFDDPDALFYVDPPYLFSTRYSSEQRYAYEMQDEQHIALADALKSLKGMVIISGYPSELYTELYREWEMHEKDTRTNANYKATECLWLSPAVSKRLKADQPTQASLFDEVN